MRPIKKDLTNQSVVIRIIDSTDGTPENAVEYDTAGIDLWYRREGATKTSITEAALSALDSAHSDGGIELIGDGYYRLDPPDAAFAPGANGVMIGGTVTGMIVMGTYIPLVDYDPQDTVRLGLTALPNAATDAAGGLPISDAGGLDLDTKLANRELLVDFVGFNDYIGNNVFYLQSGSNADDAYIDCTVIVYDVSNNNYPCVRRCTEYTGSTKKVTLDADANFSLTVSDKATIYATHNPTAEEIVDEWETQSQADPTGFHVNVAKWLGTAAATPTIAGVPEVDITYCGGSTVAAGAIPNAAADAAGGLPISDAGGLDLDAILDGSTLLLSSTINTVNSQTNLRVNGGSYHTNSYRDQIIVIYDVSIQYFQSVRRITGSSYDGDTVISLDSAPDYTVAVGDIVKIFAANTASVPDVGEIRTEMEGAGYFLDLIKDDTTEIGTAGAGLTDIGGMSTGMKAEMESEVNDALVALKLDHLIAVADADDVVDDSIIAKMTASGATADWSTFVNTDDALQAIRDRGDAEWISATGFSTHSSADVWSVAARVLTANTNFNDLDAAAVKAEVVAALADIKLDHLLNIAVDTDWGTTVHLDSVIGYMADVGGAATYDRANESMEALRARGDAAWVTGAGGSAPTVGEIRAEMEGVGTKLTLTLEDTADLQGNQAAWATATGFSTHAAADIWSVGTRALTDKSDFGLSSASINLIWDDLISGMVAVGSIGKLIADNLNASITSRSPANEYDTEMARLDVDVSSRNAIEPNTVIPDVAGTAATLHGITDGKVDAVQTDATAIKAKTDNLPSGMAKNVAVPKYDIYMVLSSDHITGATGKTVTGTISKDGGSFAVLTNTITEVSGGLYTMASGLTQAERNADVSTLVFAADDCDDLVITIISS